MSQANQFRRYPNRASLAIISLLSLPPFQAPINPPPSLGIFLRRSLLPRCIQMKTRRREKKIKKMYLFRAYRLPFKDPPELAPMPRMHTFQSFQDGRFFLVMVDAAALAVRAGVGEDSELAGVAIGAWTC